MDQEQLSQTLLDINNIPFALPLAQEQRKTEPTPTKLWARGLTLAQNREILRQWSEEDAAKARSARHITQ